MFYDQKKSILQRTSCTSILFYDTEKKDEFELTVNDWKIL